MEQGGIKQARSRMSEMDADLEGNAVRVLVWSLFPTEAETSSTLLPSIYFLQLLLKAGGSCSASKGGPETGLDNI